MQPLGADGTSGTAAAILVGRDALARHSRSTAAHVEWIFADIVRRAPAGRSVLDTVVRLTRDVRDSTGIVERNR
jgi:hypothetical protein